MDNPNRSAFENALKMGKTDVVKQTISKYVHIKCP